MMHDSGLHNVSYGGQPDLSPLPSGFDQTTDIMENFDEFMSILPNLSAPAISYNGQQSDSACHGNIPQHSGSKSNASDKLNAVERRQFKNKLAQKRFRERQKVRSSELEVQFAATTTELQELKAKQKALEARNLLLEKLVQLNNQNQQPETKVSENSQVMPEEADKLPGPLVNEMQGAGTANLTLTIRGKAQVISVTQISNLSLAEFTKLYSEYATQLAHCLMDLQEGHNENALQQLRAWILEVQLLHVAFAVRLPSRTKQVTSTKYDDMQEWPSMSPELADNLLKAIEFTEKQVLDMLYMRQIFFCKQGQLRRERSALLAKIAGSKVEQMGHASDRFAELTGWSEQLRKNGLADYRCYREFKWAYWAGTLTAEQSAKAMVYAYPYPAQPEGIMHQLAANRGEPPMQALLDDTSMDDFQHDANWQELVQYLSSITMQNVHEHVPLLSE